MAHAASDAVARHGWGGQAAALRYGCLVMVIVSFPKWWWGEHDPGVVALHRAL